MPTIFNLGSINIDHVYRISHMPTPGETLASKSYDKFLGGKGVNQSIAASLAGGHVTHMGGIGADGGWATEQIKQLAPQISLELCESGFASGHAIITVDDAGENQIIIHGGANQDLSIDNILPKMKHHHNQDHWLITQNETSAVADTIKYASQNGFKIAYSAAPFIKEDAIPLLPFLDILAVNETEANQLAQALEVSVDDLPVKAILMTKGSQGATYKDSKGIYEQSAFRVNPVDTTGAGDTFLGSFIARLSVEDTIPSALEYASAAAALQVTKPGAAVAIPHFNEVQQFMIDQKA